MKYEDPRQWRQIIVVNNWLLLFVYGIFMT